MQVQQNGALDSVLNIIEDSSGLKISDAHLDFINHYVESRCKALSISMGEYCSLLLSNRGEKENLINEAAINETYFFRETQQFDFIKENYLSSLKDQTVILWSAACSTGEEAISLYALAESCNVHPIVYASDIDTSALESFKNGYYAPHSFRDDGKKYHKLLASYGELFNNTFHLDIQRLPNLILKEYNLNDNTNILLQQNSVDIIFIRNVFIYFSLNLR